MITKEKNDVRSHIDELYEVINKGLPAGYIKSVSEKFPNVSDETIRSVKNRVNRYPKKNIQLLQYLKELALNFQEQINL